MGPKVGQKMVVSKFQNLPCPNKWFNWFMVFLEPCFTNNSPCKFPKSHKVGNFSTKRAIQGLFRGNAEGALSLGPGE